MTKVVFWDFHGTLAYDRYGWSGTMLRVLEQHRPGHAVKRATLSRLLSTGFPWHAPEKGHTEFNDDADGWWRASDRQMTRIYSQIGVPMEEARRLAGLFRETYIGCEENFIPYPDAYDALAAAREQGYNNVILSNHIPELSTIIARLPFSSLLDGIVNSAIVGYEKPHPAIFEKARETTGSPDICWMVGDNYTADYLGAREAGIPAVWVHGHDDPPDRGDVPVATLMEAIRIIMGEETGDGQG